MNLETLPAFISRWHLLSPRQHRTIARIAWSLLTHRPRRWTNACTVTARPPIIIGGRQ